ncbi:hypothetical protein PVK64_15675 [Aliivibrio sp. S4TY2]|uniref:hypothetical protein n=1 Tax=unclassified Aliivibrio TaxID=2645654 RepID=UPI002379DDC2|nr:MULTISPECIES: hypothetical protein [unclassified Aliivibrio]MDD9157611.1 hypothetical protein [Aliivibrio sp. S4TY2]MDD9161426.1 hypothetical protein [Aliivibrio sp. S4TY1]MDD9165521.1 hypothetical protein [Aliivibrio sp. S4MY2]MDD9169455.1 hypothetical protein [Aliivibrio sp. S4MY4]MDD9186448.1 hypothetical protein [Aliivibrio sp. S4MY3]
MDKARISGLLASFFTLIGLIALLSSGSHFPVYQWPYEAFQGLVFALAWGFGFSVGISYLVSTVFVLLLLIIAFIAGTKASRCVLK